jgi:uncharacterized membrane protein
MTKKEFMKQLKAALANELPASVVNENLNYYGSYIDGEVNSGRNEKDVVSGLGDPWAIARTIIETERRGGNTYSYTVEDETVSERTNYEQAGNDSDGDFFGQAKNVLKIVLVILMIFLVISAVMGVISALLPIILPVILVLAAVRLLQRR